MKIYTFYTPSHKFFLDDWFMKTISDEDKDKVHIENFEQECSTGNFMESGWNKTMLKKVNYIRECLIHDDMFFHMDSDIQFFRPFHDDYVRVMEEEDLDILAQHDGNNTVCCGCMLIKPTNKTREVFDQVYELTESGKAGNDQLALNHLLPSSGLRVGLLGVDCYSIWMNNGLRLWQPEHGIENIPNDIRIHHGNYVLGIDNKVKLMQAVRDKATLQVGGKNDII
jgi:hypothetical protein